MESVCSTKLRVLDAEKTVGGLCLEVLLGTWGPDPVLYHFVSDVEQEAISDQVLVLRIRTLAGGGGGAAAAVAAVSHARLGVKRNKARLGVSGQKLALPN